MVPDILEPERESTKQERFYILQAKPGMRYNAAQGKKVPVPVPFPQCDDVNSRYVTHRLTTYETPMKYVGTHVYTKFVCVLDQAQ